MAYEDVTSVVDVQCIAPVEGRRTTLIPTSLYFPDFLLLVVQNNFTFFVCQFLVTPVEFGDAVVGEESASSALPGI